MCFGVQGIVSRILYSDVTHGATLEDNHLSRMIVANHLKRATKFALAPGWVCRAFASPQGELRSSLKPEGF